MTLMAVSKTFLTSCRALTCMPHCLLFRRCVSLSSKDVTPLTIQQARDLLLEMVGTPKVYGEEPQREFPHILPNQKELPARHMRDSYREVIIPLGQDHNVRDKYISFVKGMRFGRILEDLDSFAGLISYTHLQDPNAKGIQKSHMAIVTAAVDRIDLYNTTLSPYLDVKLCGHVTWVGRSSMEITMNVEQVVNGIQEKMLTARFVMVARNPYTKGPGVVNPLQLEGQREVNLFSMGEQNRIARQDKAKTSLLKTAPNEYERNVIHDIFLKTIDEKSGTFNIRVKPENTVWMRDTQLKTISICHPELCHQFSCSSPGWSAGTTERNLWSKIFGGFLMRKAFELAFADASLYCKNRPTLTVVDDIIFLQPVEIGSLLFFSSEIVYTEGSLMQVRVHAEVLDILTGSRNTTNYFYFVFDSNNPNMPQVIPRTYAESMLYLDGMRHFKN